MCVPARVRVLSNTDLLWILDTILKKFSHKSSPFWVVLLLPESASVKTTQNSHVSSQNQPACQNNTVTAMSVAKKSLPCQ